MHRCRINCLKVITISALAATVILSVSMPSRLMAKTTNPVILPPVSLLLLSSASQISFNGRTYGTVVSPYTGIVWLDRNIGASQVCNTLDDSSCYGNYYQWGRDGDGHENKTSATTDALVTQINLVQPDVAGTFITGSKPYFDWVAEGVDNDGSRRGINWSRLDGSSVCPVGFRVPTIDELKDETIENSANAPFANNIDAFNNFLKFPSTGSRNDDGSMVRTGTGGYVWASNGGWIYSSGLYFRPESSDPAVVSANYAVNNRTSGLSVRCIKDMDAYAVSHNGITYYTVTSPYTGKVWLDRNLGASRVCTATDDAECYGGHYQWGRNSDGHENKGSVTSPTLAKQINPVQEEIVGKFVVKNVAPYDWTESGVDNDGNTRQNNWRQSDGSSVCPADFRVPTITEILNETIDNNANTPFANNTDAFNSFLRLPSAGMRHPTGGMIKQDVGGVMVSSSISADNFRTDTLYFLDGTVSQDSVPRERGHGFSVRCIKN